MAAVVSGDGGCTVQKDVVNGVLPVMFVGLSLKSLNRTTVSRSIAVITAGAYPLIVFDTLWYARTCPTIFLKCRQLQKEC